MKTTDFDFELPENLIAQTPLKNRAESKLLVMNKKTGVIEHTSFYDIINYIDSGSVLVMNNTKVIPARLIGIKEETNAKIELLLLDSEGDNWSALCKPAKRVKIGTIVNFGNGLLKAKCVETLEDGLRRFEMIYKGIFYEVLDELGEMPLPPYITEKLDEKDRYQTVYAKYEGSAAAPTAGLHFTNELIGKLQDKGVTILYVTLHVGLGTFRPVSVDNVLEHKMHSEYYMINKETADELNKAIRDKKKIISVGTTSTRTLEAAFNNGFKETSGYTDIFIYPGYEFKVVDSLITNFHLPKSTLLMLISALTSKEKIMNAYTQAIEKEYRFFSFGDSMFIK